MKKREVKPFIETSIKDTIYKLSFVSGISVKKICEDFCNHAFREGLGNELSTYFIRDIEIDGKYYNAVSDALKFEHSSNDIERVSMTLNSNAYDYAYDLSCAIGCSVAKVVAYALEKSMRDFEFLNRYVEHFLVNKLEEEKSSKVLNIVKTLNQGNLQEEYNLASLLLYIADEYRRFDEGIEGVLRDAYV